MISGRRMNLALFAVTAAFAAVAAFTLRGQPAQADMAPSPCPGNICTGTVVVGGQTVTYAYTQHLSSNGQFRIRLNGGVYSTTGMVSFIVHDMPAFASTGYLANPTNGAQAMTETDVNPGNTAYERRDSDGCPSCIYDQVMSVQYSGLAAGTYAFSFTVIQNGDSGGRNALPFYVDAGAPANDNEATAWGAVSGMDFPCADTYDNDLDFLADCADPQCSGSVGKVSTGALCQIPETTCNDEFDNDADGKPDCLDADCDGRVGQPSGTALCQYLNERGAGCTDNFNNDGDVDPTNPSLPLTDCADNLSVPPGNPANYCWKQSGYGCPAVENCGTAADDDKDKSYDQAWDNAPLTGVNCQDYDCAGNPACPAQENKTAGGVDADSQCFDGLDNDLDHLTDCADPDCRGVVNPDNTAQVCYDKEFDLGQRYQFCGNAFDDDGDGPQDCADSDCARRFGNCGPCPAREDYTYDSCSDGRNNDTDSGTDCADIDCSGKLGTLGNAGMCSAAENTNDACADGFDNDLNGTKDCADAGCAGRIGPLGAVCQPAGESSCSDLLDNDGDGKIDCVDPNCAGLGSCAPANWTPAGSCQVVPRFSAPTAFTGNDPTVTATVRLATHVSSVDTARFIGSATYSSVTIIMGDNTDAALYYPYAATSPTCSLTDTATGLPAARFSFTMSAGHFIQIFNTSGSDITGFDLTMTCATPATPATLRDYPISISVLKEPGDVAEVGEADFSTTLYEATAPSMLEVEPEAELAAIMKVPYGGFADPPSRRFRGVPNDPGAGLDSSGICRCDIEVAGTPYPAGPDCVTSGLTFLSDASVGVRGRAEDGAGNLGAYNGVSTFTVDVTPVLKTPLTVGPPKPFFKDGSLVMTLDSEFYTGASDSFPAGCDVYVRDTAGNVIGGPPGPTLTMPGMPVNPGYIRCLGTPSLPGGMPDGMYFVTVKATDSDGDSAESNRKAIFVCNSVPAAGDPEPTNGCQYADFDGDGATEGLYTTVYSTAPKACDNCIGLRNADQTDTNANGVGDICEPNDQYGRCEIDTDIVCSYNSDDATHGCPAGSLCCPGPSNGIDYSNDLSPAVPKYQPKDPQMCKMAWGICTLGGQVCFEDADCPGTGGLCQDGATTCFSAADCAALPGSASCSNFGGNGLCQDSITACRRDVDCVAISGTPLCTGADRCENLLYPWLQTVYGNVFSKKKITAPDVPPQNQYNATFCITAKDTIFNFQTQGLGGCSAQTDASVRYELPQGANTYSSVLGKLDLGGLRAGKYGTVINVGSGQLDTILNSYSNSLGGRVFRVTGDATLGAHTFVNDAVNGAGSVFVDGGDLTVTGNVQYDATSVTNLDQLASFGIIAVDNGTGTKGNVYVDGAVTVVSAALYAGGSSGFYSVAPPLGDSPAPFTLYGFAVARQFNLSRSFKSVTQGSERFIYDGRAVVNPPPGFSDITRAMPLFTDTPTAP